MRTTIRTLELSDEGSLLSGLFDLLVGSMLLTVNYIM